MPTCPNTQSANGKLDNINQFISDNSNITSSATDIIRAPQGYVFEGSWVFNTQIIKEDMAYVDTSADNMGQWYISVDSSTDVPGIRPGIRPENCEPLSIVDSDKEYHVLTGNIEDEHQLVRCNEGYVFDHDLKHREGLVKCSYLPKMGSDDDLREKNEMAWVVATDNGYFEDICSDQSTLLECENATDPNLEDGSSNTIGCVWSPEYENNGFTKSSECLYRKRVDYNHSDPICKPMYCQQKEVRFSNRVEEVSGPLPGPDTERVHGSCINFDGQIIDNITNSSDCNCFKHKSCDRCTEGGSDCQWCGNDDNGEGGFCYSTKTHLDICNTSVQHDRGGSCIDKLSGDVKGIPSGDANYKWSQSECESNICANEYNWQHGIPDITDLMVNGENLSRENISRDNCLSLNNTWDEHGVHNYDDKCVFTNRGLTSVLESGNIGNYYPVLDASNVTLNISEHICIPTDMDTATDLNTRISNCDPHSTKKLCEDSDSCTWIQNPLRDSLFQWTNDSKINFQNIDENCPIASKDGGYTISIGSDHITLIGSALEGLLPTYNTLCPISSGDFYGVNLIDQNDCGKMHGYTEFNQCLGGMQYCDSTMTVNDNDAIPACPPGEPLEINGEIIEGCEYNLDPPTDYSGDIPGENNCHSNLVTPKCSIIGENIPYNCINQSVNGQRDENYTYCMETGYIVDDTDASDYNFRSTDNFQYETGMKDFVICNTSPLDTDNETDNEIKCGFIGEENAHYGGLCVKDGYKLPMKHICESMVGYEWTKQQDAGDIVPVWKCVNANNIPIYDDQVCDLINFVDTYVSIGSTDPNDRKWINPTTSNPYCVENDSTSVDDGTEYTFETCPPIETRTWTDDACTVDGITDDGITDEYLCRDKFVNNLWTHSDKECIIDGSNINNVNELEGICTNFENHSIGFDYSSAELLGDFTGSCDSLDPSRQNEVNEIRNKQQCEENNNIYTQKYDYHFIGSCESIGDDRLSDQPDINTIWEGGEVTSDGEGGHTSECSASLLSSCNVDCNPGYGGGGEYICQYNNDGEKICDDVNRKDVDELNGVSKGDLCERYPNCVWTSDDSENSDKDNGTCSANPNGDPDAVHGHLEWLGSECYKLNRQAFSHGIAEIPELDELFPPVWRILFIIGLFFACIVLFFYVISPGFKLIGKGFDFIWNTSGWILGKVIDMNLQGSDLPQLFLNKFKHMIKLGFMNVILLFTIIPGITFVITYYLYEWSEEHTNAAAKKIVNFIETGITDLIQYLSDLTINIETYQNSERKDEDVKP